MSCRKASPCHFSTAPHSSSALSAAHPQPTQHKGCFALLCPKIISKGSNNKKRKPLLSGETGIKIRLTHLQIQALGQTVSYLSKRGETCSKGCRATNALLKMFWVLCVLAPSLGNSYCSRSCVLHNQDAAR